MHSSRELPQEAVPDVSQLPRSMSATSLYTRIMSFLHKHGLFGESSTNKQDRIEEEESKLEEYSSSLRAETSISILQEMDSQDTAELNDLYEETKPEPKIATGSFGSVTKEICQGQTVAIKKIPLMTNRCKLSDCEREVKIMQDLKPLHSPYIVQLKAYNYNLYDFYIMMEYVAGGSLADYIDEHPNAPFEWKVRYNIMQQLVQGLIDIHSKNILHCDLKSENVLLDNIDDEEKLQVKYCDFGSSKYIGEKLYTQSTVLYSAPELIIETAPDSEKSDVYRLGMLFWQIAAWNANPYKDQAMAAVLVAIANGARLDVPEACPPKIGRLIKWCWQQDLALRPADQELLHEVKMDMDTMSEGLQRMQL